jgi:hypothetical protein
VLTKAAVSGEGESSEWSELVRWVKTWRLPGWLGLTLVSVFAFQLVLDFRILPPTAIDWIFSFHSDTAQYYLAFAYYRNSAWHFPLTHLDTMLYPVGASFMQADGIPLLAIPLKLVSAILPVDFQFYGAWLFSCIALTAVFAKLLLERLLTSRALIWAGTLLIALAPPLVARFGHCHLAAHWLLLAAFWTVMETRALPVKRIWLFSTLAFFVQPYLFAIVSGVLVTAFWVHRRERRRLLVGAFVWLVAILLSAWVLGYFALGRSDAGQGNNLHADLTALFSSMGTSTIVPALPMAGEFRRVWHGKAEGYAYLGLGGILLFVLLLAQLFASRFSKRGLARLHPSWVVLGVASLALAAFAISPSPNLLGHRFGGIAFLTELIDPVTARLRSAGRFIWPLYYFVLLFGLQALENWLDRLELRRATWASALVLLGFQAADIGPWLVGRGQRAALVNPLPLEVLPEVVRSRYSKATRTLVFDPPIQRMFCRGRGDEWQDRSAYYPLALFGARNDLRVNTDFRASSRLTWKEIEAVCAFAEKTRQASPPSPDVMVVTPADAKLIAAAAEARATAAREAKEKKARQAEAAKARKAKRKKKRRRAD